MVVVFSHVYTFDHIGFCDQWLYLVVSLYLSFLLLLLCVAFCPMPVIKGFSYWFIHLQRKLLNILTQNFLIINTKLLLDPMRVLLISSPNSYILTPNKYIPSFSCGMFLVTFLAPKMFYLNLHSFLPPPPLDPRSKSKET